LAGKMLALQKSHFCFDHVNRQIIAGFFLASYIQRAGFFLANQGFLKHFRVALIGWIKAGPPKSHLTGLKKCTNVVNLVKLKICCMCLAYQVAAMILKNTKNIATNLLI